MSIPFSHFFQKINQIAPLEADFTEVLDAIVLKPKILYFYGKIPQNVSKSAESEGPNSLQGATDIASEPTQNTLNSRPKSVAIVGSRHNTKYGEEIAYQLAYALAKKGVIVVSGLAYGIDSIAHQGCLDAGGTTVAVLGTAINDLYPKSHIPLAAQIIEQGGAIISEYAPRASGYTRVDGQAALKRVLPGYEYAPLAPGEAGYLGLKSTQVRERAGRRVNEPQVGERASRWTNEPVQADKRASRWANPLSVESREHPDTLARPFPLRRLDQKLTFLYRNRLIAGLADITVVVEAAERSGSLNTAGHAIDQGKEVFAAPGNINSFYSRGCNSLIAHGANPYTSPDDILRLLFPSDYLKKRKNTSLRGSTPEETAILEALSTGLADGEDIARHLGVTPAEFSQQITLLELKSRVRSLGANHWSLV